jgi:hypothetical protein
MPAVHFFESVAGISCSVILREFGQTLKHAVVESIPMVKLRSAREPEDHYFLEEIVLWLDHWLE